ncbi:hypothetical protein PVAP13_7KG335800 [Panicum virgatum]|uniref:Uncharacterized protein n=1 Tax=Panicum virgatum TaxID=38727 RepID=A0A8T0QN18_PANVG|nr:hypothetical protein PVAP13_7KG335800 [Panicum virgatum]
MAAPNGPATSPMVTYPFYPAGAFPQQAGDDQAQGPGIYAIQQNQLAAAMGMGCYAPTTLVPLTYKIPTYQTGAITPFVRWLQRAGGVAARPPQAPARVENRAPLPAQNDGNGQPNDPANPDQAAENQEPGAADGNENPQGAEGEGNQRNWLGGILKEVQLVVVGFVASLLPGFQHND